MSAKNKIFEARIEYGALLDVPVYWDDRKGRSRNWLAVIWIDPRAPGGLGRKFAKRARGDYYYFVDEIELFDPVEFGADYKRHRNRWYGVVVEKAESKMVFEQADTARQAIRRAAELKKAAEKERVRYVKIEKIETEPQPQPQ